jgi:hypothetical protein
MSVLNKQEKTKLSYIDALEVVIQMTKSTENIPDFSGKKKGEIAKLLKLSVDAETLKDFGFTHYRVIKGGEKSESIKISDGCLEGFPTLKLRLYAYPDMNQVRGRPLSDDQATIGSCFSYQVQGGPSDNCFFEDQNGYTDIIRVTGEMKPPEWFEEKVMQKCVVL